MDIPRIKRPKGEAFVWLAGMGLAAGLLMVVGLLIVVLWNGMEAFWPRPVMQIELKAGAQIIGRQTIAGELIQQKLNSHDGSEERQLFVGNKDVYSQSFVYITETDIQKLIYPKNLLQIERREYGDAIIIPERLALADGTSLTAAAAGFDERLYRLIREVRSRWDDIEDIEKHRIGAINRDLEVMKYALKRREGSKLTPKQQLEKTELTQAYETLAAEAKLLRGEQTKDILHYHLPSGEPGSLAVGQIIHAYYPNQQTFTSRLALMGHNIWAFLSEDPREANTEGGIFPALFGTFVMTLLMCLVVTPFGVIAAIYLREYAKQGLWVRMVRIAINNLAGVPSIVFGVFGMGFFVYMVGGTIDSLFFWERLPTPTFGTGGLLWAALTLALMTVPVVIVATEEALAAVSQGIREASLACGASKWQTIQKIVMPAAAPGILTGMVLAMARGAGEVAPLMLVGVVKLAPELSVNGIFPYVHLDQKFMHLGFHIYDLGFQSPDSEAAKPMVFATTLLLIAVVFAMNLGAILVRERLRRKYKSGAF